MSEKIFSISEAARLTHMTSETLRHYDRVGLVKPSHTDAGNGYRRYSPEDLVRLNTVHALRCMDLSLREIQTLLNCQDLGRLVAMLGDMYHRADQKIAELEQAKAKIRAAQVSYETKLPYRQSTETMYTQDFPRRMLLLSNTLTQPTLDNLWNYLRHFHEQAGADDPAFSFEDTAGVYTAEGCSRLFAVCSRYPASTLLTELPAGRYLCADCSEAALPATLDALTQAVRERTGHPPAFTVQQIVISGILQWTYQVQLPL